MNAGLLKDIETAEKAVADATTRLCLWAIGMEDIARNKKAPHDAINMIDELQARKYELLAAHSRLLQLRTTERQLREQAQQGASMKAANDEGEGQGDD